VVYKGAKAEVAAAQRQYRRIVKNPNSGDEYLDAIEEAMRSRMRLLAKKVWELDDWLQRAAMPATRIPKIFLGCLAFLHLALSSTAIAQAWVPLKGEGSVSSTYSNMYVRNHVNGIGIRSPRLGRIRTNTVLTSVDYGVTDNFALNVDLAYVASKYIGGDPHGPKDTGSYHPTFQDAHIELRYNALKKHLVVTPFIGATLPIHDYETRGHSAVGRGFHELLIGVNVGRQLDRILRDSYVHGRYSYAVLGGFEDLKLNRSNADCEVGWFATRSFSLRFIAAFQKTHGGIVTPLEPEVDDHEREFHDRITRSNYINLGGGIGFSANRTFGIHAAYLTNVYARSVHAPGGFLIGISWNFSRGLEITQTSTDTSPRPLARVAY
jgi:hypothetical protein